MSCKFGKHIVNHFKELVLILSVYGMFLAVDMLEVVLIVCFANCAVRVTNIWHWLKMLKDLAFYFRLTYFEFFFLKWLEFLFVDFIFISVEELDLFKCADCSHGIGCLNSQLVTVYFLRWSKKLNFRLVDRFKPMKHLPVIIIKSHHHLRVLCHIYLTHWEEGLRIKFRDLFLILAVKLSHDSVVVKVNRTALNIECSL